MSAIEILRDVVYEKSKYGVCTSQSVLNYNFPEEIKSEAMSYWERFLFIIDHDTGQYFLIRLRDKMGKGIVPITIYPEAHNR